MANKKAIKQTAKKASAKTEDRARPASQRKSNSTENKPQQYGEPVFPYTNKPGSLRKFLQLIPSKPRPTKIEKGLMRSWGFADTNDMSILRVLRAVGLLTPTNEPSPLYTSFMSLNNGATSLAASLKTIYAPLFAASHTPYKESPETLKSLFHINSGGSPTTLEYQVQTFKALAESTAFDQVNLSEPPTGGSGTPDSSQISGQRGAFSSQPTVHIDLHIHLPENKSRRDYEAIIEEIGRSIYGKSTERDSDE